jgi:hypothetical protein
MTRTAAHAMVLAATCTGGLKGSCTNAVRRRLRCSLERFKNAARAGYAALPARSVLPVDAPRRATQACRNAALPALHCRAIRRTAPMRVGLRGSRARQDSVAALRWNSSRWPLRPDLILRIVEIAAMRSAGSVCNGGACRSACEPGAACTGSVDVLTDLKLRRVSTSAPGVSLRRRCLPSVARRNACSGVCVRMDVDDNCGACGNACKRQERTTGQCIGSCRGETECSCSCVSLDSDVQNCGACGLRCPSGAGCMSNVRLPASRHRADARESARQQRTAAPVTTCAAADPRLRSVQCPAGRVPQRHRGPERARVTADSAVGAVPRGRHAPPAPANAWWLSLCVRRASMSLRTPKLRKRAGLCRIVRQRTVSDRVTGEAFCDGRRVKTTNNQFNCGAAARSVKLKNIARTAMR